MIIFNAIRTKRLAVRLREISIEEAVAVCRLPAGRHEACATEFLRFVARDAETPTANYVKDPRLMTVEERTLLICNYLSQVLTTGPDFAVGDKGLYSHYVKFDDDLTRDSMKMGVVCGKDRTLYPLLGMHAEALERVCTDQGEWILGVIACTVFADDETLPDFPRMTEIAMLDWVGVRIAALKAMAESDVEEMYAQYESNKVELRHFFSTGVDDDGILIWPQPEAKGAGNDSPARFLAISCISEFTKRIFTRPDKSGGGAVDQRGNALPAGSANGPQPSR